MAPIRPSRRNPRRSAPGSSTGCSSRKTPSAILERRRTHLYVFDIATKSMKQVTSGDYDDNDPAWSPDGKLLAFASNRSKPDPDATYAENIWVVLRTTPTRAPTPTQVTTGIGRRSSTRLVSRRQVDRLLHPARSQALRLRHKTHCRGARHRRAGQSAHLGSGPQWP